MTTPAFVGVGPVTSSTSPTWPTSQTITSGKEPSGIAVGDRVFLIIAMMGPFGSSHSSVDHFDVSNPAWTATNPASSTYPLTTPARVGVHVFTARWAPSLLPVTVSPRDTSDVVVDSDSYPAAWWKCYLAAWSPSATPATGVGRTASGGGYLPRTSAPWGTGAFASDGTAVVFAHGNMGVYSTGTLNGFTTRANPGDDPRWFSSAPDVALADKTIASGGSSSGPHFDATIGIYGGGLMFRLDTPDPPIRAGGWSVGFIKW